ncbi:MAG: archaellin/type IV pilin N-terminal domain-containing protein [archaeon]
MRFVKKMLSKIGLKRKGITPVIAIVLLLMMTVAAAGMAYVWIMSVQEGVEAQANEGLAKQQTDASAAIKIESVWNSTTSAYFVLRNTGTYSYSDEDVNQFAYYVDGVPQTTISQTCAGSTSKLKAPGSICEVHLTTSTFPASAGDTKVISVKSPVGRSAEYSCTRKSTTSSSC